MRSKNSQASGIVLDLTKSKVSLDALGNVMGRLKGAGADNLKEVIIVGRLFMPAILCRCGDKLSWSAIPNPIEWKFLSDPDFEKFTGAVDAEVIYQEMSSFLRCRSCKRLWVFWDGFDSPPSEYALQSPDGGMTSEGE